MNLETATILKNTIFLARTDYDLMRSSKTAENGLSQEKKVYFQISVPKSIAFSIQQYVLIVFDMF